MTGNVTVQRSGVRTVELFVPYEFQGIKVEAISVGPFLFDHTLRWWKGSIDGWFSLLVEMAVNATTNKPMRDDDLRQLRYPDADRVIDAFFSILPTEVRQAITDNYWPTVATPDIAAEQTVPVSTDAGGMQPDRGFDIGDG